MPVVPTGGLRRGEAPKLVRVDDQVQLGDQAVVALDHHDCDDVAVAPQFEPVAASQVHWHELHTGVQAEEAGCI